MSGNVRRLYVGDVAAKRKQIRTNVEHRINYVYIIL